MYWKLATIDEGTQTNVEAAETQSTASQSALTAFCFSFCASWRPVKLFVFMRPSYHKSDVLIYKTFTAHQLLKQHDHLNEEEEINMPFAI